ncbi:hypothetical protein K1719_029577 [Acacia pycnantha]|nr:hypothetical protein K1719_029577 [Acacia pycnantha]
MAFWTDKNVKRRVLVEKKSNKGLLLRSKPRQQLPQASVPPSTSFDPDTMLTHPVVRSTYARLLYNLQQEMLTPKIHCPKKASMKGEETPTHVDGGLGREQEVKELGLELRRSRRVVIPSSVLKSPWIDPKLKSKGKRTYDEKDTLFEMCTKSVTRERLRGICGYASLFPHKGRATMSDSTKLD